VTGINAPHQAASRIPESLDILNALTQPVICVDAENIICFANLTAETFFNTSRSQLVGRGLEHFLLGDSPLLSLVRDVRSNGTSYAEFGVDISLPNAMRHLMDIQVSPFVDHAGWVLITLQSRAIARLINRQQSHQSAARSVVGVSGMLAHEIKNPLSGIRGAAQLLEDGADENTRDLTQLICIEVDRIRALLDRMEVFTDTRPLDRQPENIHMVLTHIRQIAENGFAKGLAIREYYDPSLPPVLGNRDRLIQLFLNLIKNAAEAIGGQHGEIVMTTAFRHGVRVAVRGSSKRISLPIEICMIDNGPGAPVDLVDLLFDPFVTTKTAGSGLGLAMAAQIVSEHGGVIEYDRQSDPARTVFRVLLPMHQENMP
jgi:two-component system, NtrC family, nitrogen regulation sensor histidine kinase GlnL